MWLSGSVAVWLSLFDYDCASEKIRVNPRKSGKIPQISVVRGPWPVARGPWSVVRGPWPVAHGPWPVACSLWPVACGQCTTLK